MAGEIAERNSFLIRPIVSAHRLAGRRRFRRSGTIARRSPSVRQRQAFTLIELLVVISIITLLMAILLPTLQRVRSQAKAVVCRSNLRQWGVIFSISLNDNDGKLPGTGFSSVSPRDIARTYLNGIDINIYNNDFAFCPMATRPELRPDRQFQKGNSAATGPIVDIVGSTSTAWCWRGPPPSVFEVSGSYGLNSFIRNSSVNDYPGSLRNNVPIYLDCIYTRVSVNPYHKPPEYEDHINSPVISDMTYVCIDRHSGGINSLFLDFSVRKVGLKELWMLKWNKYFHTTNYWTRAGGVLPEDWPKWMRGFKDY